MGWSTEEAVPNSLVRKFYQRLQIDEQAMFGYTDEDLYPTVYKEKEHRYAKRTLDFLDSVDSSNMDLHMGTCPRRDWLLSLLLEVHRDNPSVKEALLHAQVHCVCRRPVCLVVLCNGI